jgi:hypothetical protein
MPRASPAREERGPLAAIVGIRGRPRRPEAARDASRPSHRPPRPPVRTSRARPGSGAARSAIAMQQPQIGRRRAVPGLPRVPASARPASVHAAADALHLHPAQKPQRRCIAPCPRPPPPRRARGSGPATPPRPVASISASITAAPGMPSSASSASRPTARASRDRRAPRCRQADQVDLRHRAACSRRALEMPRSAARVGRRPSWPS